MRSSRNSYASLDESSDGSVGALFAVYGAGVLGVSAFRRMQGNRQFFSEVGDDGLSRKRYEHAHGMATVERLTIMHPGFVLVATWSSS